LGTLTANPLLAGFWVYVYGLMVYLLAAAFPSEGRRRPCLLVTIGAVVLPVPVAVPVAIVVLLHIPRHELPPPG
jgi:hypothetical protein